MQRITVILCIATVLSVAYILRFGSILHDADPQNLNEHLQMFSSFFTPLAFIWVVAGFYQQREAIMDTRKALQIAEQSERARIRSVQPVFKMTMAPKNVIGYELNLINRGAPATQLEITCDSVSDSYKKDFLPYQDIWKMDWKYLFKNQKGPLVFRITYLDATHAHQTQKYVYENEEFIRLGSLPLAPTMADH